MAYFLDPELAALTRGKTPLAAAASPAPTGKRSGPKNKFGKTCMKCSAWVPAGKGYLAKVDGAWVVYCATCP